MNIKSEHHLHEVAFEKIKEILSGMNDLTEEEFYIKYRNDAKFRSGVKVLTQVLLRSNEDTPYQRVPPMIVGNEKMEYDVDFLKVALFKSFGIPQEYLSDELPEQKVVKPNKFKSYIDKQDGSSRVSYVNKKDVEQLTDVLKRFGHKIKQIAFSEGELCVVRYERRNR